MKLLHTSDWHFGKFLESKSRIEEQKLFIDEMDSICEENNIDLIIIAGDIYDTYNPSAEAEQLFFKSLSRLSKQGSRPIIVIAGNHDSSDRLDAPVPLSREQGIILVSTPKTTVEVGKFNDYEIVNSGEGFFEIELKGERAVILTMPYPSEKRLNEIISDKLSEKDIQKEYSEKIGELFENLSQNYREDTINIAIGHFYVTGGEISDSERDISIGGAYAVDAKHLPQKAQYIALGHLHRPQRVNGVKNAYYSGSPLQYSKSEIGYAKSVYIVDINSCTEANITKYPLKNYKPIEVWNAKSVQEVIDRCKDIEDDSIYIYLNLSLDRVMKRSEIKELKSLNNPIFIMDFVVNGQDTPKQVETYKEKTFIEEFADFYMNQRNAEPSKEVLDVLQIIVSGGENETN